jgi:hypothetical protein
VRLRIEPHRTDEAVVEAIVRMFGALHPDLWAAVGFARGSSRADARRWGKLGPLRVDGAHVSAR